MIEIEISGKNFSAKMPFPSEWLDIPEAERLTIFRILYHTRFGMIPKKSEYEGKRGRAMRVIVPMLMGKNAKYWKNLSATQKMDLVHLLDFLEIAPTTKPFFTHFTHQGVTYHSPRESMLNATAIEYPMASYYFSEYVKTNDLRELYKMAAVLYRPENADKNEVTKKADARLPIHDNSDEETQRAKIFETLNVDYVIAAMYFFIGCKNQINLYGKNSGIFEDEENEEDSDENISQKTQINELQMWRGIFQDVSETGIFGTYDQVCQRPFWEILQFLIRKKEEENKKNAPIKTTENNDL